MILPKRYLQCRPSRLIVKTARIRKYAALRRSHNQDPSRGPNGNLFFLYCTQYIIQRRVLVRASSVSQSPI